MFGFSSFYIYIFFEKIVFKKFQNFILNRNNGFRALDGKAPGMSISKCIHFFIYFFTMAHNDVTLAFRFSKNNSFQHQQLGSFNSK